MSFAFQILSFLSWSDLGRAMLVCRQWAEVIIVIPIALIMISIHIFITILMISFITFLNHQAGHRRWAEFSLHLEGDKLITFSGIKR